MTTPRDDGVRANSEVRSGDGKWVVDLGVSAEECKRAPTTRSEASEALNHSGPGLMKSGPYWRISRWTIWRFLLRDGFVTAVAGMQMGWPSDSGGPD